MLSTLRRSRAPLCFTSFHLTLQHQPFAAPFIELCNKCAGAVLGVGRGFGAAAPMQFHFGAQTLKPK